MKKTTYKIHVQTPQGYDNFQSDPITITEGEETEENIGRITMMNLILEPSKAIAYLRFEIKGKLIIIPSEVAHNCIFTVEGEEVE